MPDDGFAPDTHATAANDGFQPDQHTSALSRGASAFWEGVGGKQVMDMIGGASRDPVRAQKAWDAAKDLINGLAGEPARVWSELSQSGKEMIAGHLAAATYHLAGATPLVGGAAQRVATDVDQGKYAEAAGHAAGLILPFALGATAGGGGTEAAAGKTVKVPSRAAATVRGAAAGAADQLPNAIAGAGVGALLKGPEGAALGAGVPLVRGAVKGAVKGYREFNAVPVPKPDPVEAATEYYRNQNIPAAEAQPAAASPQAATEPAAAAVPAEAPPPAPTIPGEPPQVTAARAKLQARIDKLKAQNASLATTKVLQEPAAAAATPEATPAPENAPAAPVIEAKPTPEEMASVFNPDRAAFEKAQAARKAAANAKHMNARKAWVSEMADRLFQSGKGLTPQDLQEFSQLQPDGTYVNSPELDQLARAGGNGKRPVTPISKMDPETVLRLHDKLRELWNDYLPKGSPPIGQTGILTPR